ncbi:hypothetical protein Glove_134g268 [Diversispora epigaea]|uniref:Uncharacterized protein n=1 Tax=Diversispora epigaea TaxID=1348612 RepID=A0A397IX51_9GLOM|nr:hypothetical protein Glove_134g268 [Diversispora epigaea]
MVNKTYSGKKQEALHGLYDKGIDIKGMKKDVKFIIEYRSIINQIEGVFSRQSNGTIGIV